jgi:hypothetical protein
MFTIFTATIFILLLLLLFCYCYYYKTIATDTLLRASLFPGAAELTTHLLRLINILWLPLCRINKFGFYLPRRLLRSLILVGHQDYFLAPLPGSIALFVSSLGIYIVRYNPSIMGKPRDGNVPILPSTTRRGTTLNTSVALDSPSMTIRDVVRGWYELYLFSFLCIYSFMWTCLVCSCKVYII